MSRPHSDERIFDVLYQCRAMRRLKADPVPEDVLVQLVDAALQAPSGSNAQNWTFVIVRDPEQRRKVQALWQRTWDLYLATFARAPQRPGEDLAARERMLRAGTYMVEHLHAVPAIVFVGVKQDEALAQVLSSPRTLATAMRLLGPMAMVRLVTGSLRTTGMADGSTAYPAVQNLLLAARALGLGAVLTTPHFFVPGEFEALLGMPRAVTLAAAVPVGWPRGRFGPVSRPDARSVIAWDRVGGNAGG
jgi:nitroreductase